MTRIICGVDISSASLAARIGRDGATGSFPNTAEGIVALASFCHAHVVELVAMEATGGYEQQPFALLWEQGLPVTAQRNQSRLVTASAVLAWFTELLALVARQIRELEIAIAALISEDPLWHQLDQVFRSIKGVADRTVARLMAEMPEIGTLSNKAISKLAGVAPLARDSGKQQGKRAVRGGRPQVREILFVVAGVAGRYEPDFIAFQQRLRAAGKPGKVIRIALAHKLLVRLNAKAREVRQHMATEMPDLRAPIAVTN